MDPGQESDSVFSIIGINTVTNYHDRCVLISGSCPLYTKNNIKLFCTKIRQVSVNRTLLNRTLFGQLSANFGSSIFAYFQHFRLNKGHNFCILHQILDNHSAFELV